MKTILVVDDDEMNLKMARFMLEQNKYDVITVNSGMDCLKVLNEKKDIDLAVKHGISRKVAEALLK